MYKKMLIVADVLQASDQRRNHCWQLQMRDNFFNIGVYNVLYLSNELQNLVSRNLVCYCCIYCICNAVCFSLLCLDLWYLKFHHFIFIFNNAFYYILLVQLYLTVNQICAWEEECKIPYLFLVTTSIFASLC